MDHTWWLPCDERTRCKCRREAPWRRGAARSSEGTTPSCAAPIHRRSEHVLERETHRPSDAAGARECLCLELPRALAADPKSRTDVVERQRAMSVDDVEHARVVALHGCRSDAPRRTRIESREMMPARRVRAGPWNALAVRARQRTPRAQLGRMDDGQMGDSSDHGTSRQSASARACRRGANLWRLDPVSYLRLEIFKR